MTSYSKVLDNIPFQVDAQALAQRLRIKDGTPSASTLRSLLEQAQRLARPKALYRLAFIETRGDDWIVMEGTRLSSRVLRVNLESAHRAFPYVATCGTELAEWATSFPDLLERFWADAISEAALRLAYQALSNHVAEEYRPGHLSHMNPGSLPDWPLDQQRPLFAILGNVEEAIGVRLTESLLMVPVKSVSGILFPTGATFESCQLCPREQCPGRSAPYDQNLLNTRYRGAVTGNA